MVMVSIIYVFLKFINVIFLKYVEIMFDLVLVNIWYLLNYFNLSICLMYNIYLYIYMI